MLVVMPIGGNVATARSTTRKKTSHFSTSKGRWRDIKVVPADTQRSAKLVLERWRNDPPRKALVLVSRPQARRARRLQRGCAGGKYDSLPLPSLRCDLGAKDAEGGEVSELTYSSAVVHFLDRDPQTVKAATLYPVTRIELQQFTGNDIITTKIFVVDERGAWVEAE